ncbi:hypothetical protein PoB_007042100 [Plakobranchus ocellatus]|uniref:Uncharacterized protein n=1 Tax=Plakobranchus ocellatus TaxID=259542 RepID=A0AAV4DIE1_9GAST|nr:hypothetical protein PoB_007042100 [Plakobranchus ocellatus]
MINRISCRSAPMIASRKTLILVCRRHKIKRNTLTYWTDYPQVLVINSRESVSGSDLSCEPLGGDTACSLLLGGFWDVRRPPMTHEVHVVISK